MPRIVTAAALVLMVTTLPAAGQQFPGPLAIQDSTPAAVPQSQVPAPQAPAPQTPVPQPLRQASLATRTFTAPYGLLFNTVRPDRVADFEALLYYLQDALAKSTDPTIRAQAKAWRVLKASEAGPNGSVLYVFVIDPTVAGADYGLGRILADVYTDPVQLQQIWKLYTDSVTGGGSLLNLTPVQPVPPEVPLGGSLVPAPQMLPPKP